MQQLGKRGIRAIRERTIVVVALGLALVATLMVILFSGLGASSAGAEVSRSADSSGGADVSGSPASSAQVDEKRFPLEGSLSGPVLQSLPAASNAAENFGIFMLEATGVANEFGEFSFVGTLVQDRSIVPPECTSGVGSTGEGSGRMIFPNGMLRVRTSNSQACVDSADASNIAVVIDYRIVGRDQSL